MPETTMDLAPEALSLQIQNRADLEAAAKLLHQLRERRDTISFTYSNVKDSANKAHKSACDFFKTFDGPLEKAEEAVKKKIANYIANGGDFSKLEGITVKMIPKFGVIHPELLSREYLCADLSKIGEVVKSLRGEAAHAPGLKDAIAVWEEPSICIKGVA